MEVHLFMTYYNKHVHSQYILHIFSFMQSEENLLTVNTLNIFDYHDLYVGLQ